MSARRLTGHPTLARRAARLMAVTALALTAASSPAGEREGGADPALTAERVVARYREARGGVDAWRRLRALEMRGTCSAFSQRADCRLIRKRGDLFRLDFALLGAPAIRARDAGGPWGVHKLLQPEPGRWSLEAYLPQLEREAQFEPPLLDHAAKGIAVELLGRGELDGRPTIDLRLVFPGGREETWRLDADTYLEVAVDSQVVDYTQGDEPMAQRAFFDDFRPVGELVLPFRIDLEFGARLEEMIFREATLDPALDDAEFAPPAAPGG